MVGTRSRGKVKAKNNDGENGNGGHDYEESRAQRIKENKERMQSLGIFDLSKKLSKPAKPTSSTRKIKPPIPNSIDPPRRSSRLKDMPTVSYLEKKPQKKEPLLKNVEVHIAKGEKPEFYTEEHEKLLGDSEATWTLMADGYGEDGLRIYDPFEGKSCHQCRQKTLGHRTKCRKCKAVTGQFCGDCLYMRYGENVIEVNENPNWICPVCRGICNCSRCRRENGWAPTGAIYRKVVNLGFKSVAHYLIHTFRENAENPIPPNKLLSIDDEKESPLDALSVPSSGGNKAKMEENDSDEEYKGDDCERDIEEDSENSN
ncbi:hypothetical protein ACJIZ3_004677 [Penstemon smallii]|uniref:Zinc-finger domain-containing protein n=1 Tax=Penstemon smallii TaxID=265156 RepID=A0ABD3S2T7_9LAMI